MDRFIVKTIDGSAQEIEAYDMNTLETFVIFRGVKHNHDKFVAVFSMRNIISITLPPTKQPSED